MQKEGINVPKFGTKYESGRVQVSTENNTMKIDDEKIKEVLRHHQDLTRQIHEQVIDIRKKIDEVNQQCLEIASYPNDRFQR